VDIEISSNARTHVCVRLFSRLKGKLLDEVRAHSARRLLVDRIADEQPDWPHL
jgi:hypothetical protein